MIVSLHHVGIVTSDLESTSAQLSDLFGIPAAAPRSVKTDHYALRTAMVPLGNGTHLQIIEPAIGPGVSDLASRGDGAVVEIAFEVRDISATAAHLRERGLEPVDFGGRTLADDYATAASGNRYLYLPAGSTLGTRVELIQPMG